MKDNINRYPKIIILCMVLNLGLTSMLTGQSILELTDIYQLEKVDQPEISPDGKKIIYTRKGADVKNDVSTSRLWMFDIRSSTQRPITRKNFKAHSAKWSNDGTRIAYINSGKNNGSSLVVRWLDSKKEVIICEGVYTPNQFTWSPDDKFIAYSQFVPVPENVPFSLPTPPKGASWQAKPQYIDYLPYRSDGEGYLTSGFRQIFVSPSSGGAPRQITSGPYNHNKPAWSIDGQTLYISANRSKNPVQNPWEEDLFAIDINQRTYRQLTHRKGPDTDPQVSPDGKRLAYLGFDNQKVAYQQQQLYVMNVDGSEKKILTQAFDRHVRSYQWFPDNRSLIINYADEGKMKIGRINFDGEVKEWTDDLGGLSTGRPYNSGNFSIAGNGSCALTMGNADHPAELGLYDQNQIQRLTHINDWLLNDRKLGEIEEIRVESSYDQQPIQGWIVKPPDFDENKKYPMILEIHGGPFLSYGWEFSFELQHYAAAGYVVLYMNPRGSLSYGEEFAQEILNNYPGNDYDDLISGVEFMLEKPYIDPERLFVTGGSGGGVLTAWIVGHTDRFRAAVVAKPVINMQSFVLYADNPAYFANHWFTSYPWEDPETYFRLSPLSYVGHVQTPTLIITGENDYRTPIAESEQYYAALKLEGVESALVRLRGSSHGIYLIPSNLMAKIAVIIGWFDEHGGRN